MDVSAVKHSSSSTYTTIHYVRVKLSVTLKAHFKLLRLKLTERSGGGGNYFLKFCTLAGGGFRESLLT